jgi:hypothetical protein
MRVGKHELAWLQSLVRPLSGFKTGHWRCGAGRVWTTEAATVRLCESLARKGLLQVVEGEKRPIQLGGDRRVWEVTELGYEIANQKKAA